MSVKISLKGLNPDKFNDLVSIFDQELTGALVDVGGDWQADTKANTPVDTGDLQRSWTLTGPSKNGKNLEIELSNNIAYAPHVEYGHRTRNKTSYVKGVYMLKNATITAEENLEDALDEAIKRIEGSLS